MRADLLRRTVWHPLTEEMLRPLAPETVVVQVDGTLTGPEFARLNELLRGYPTVSLRVFVFSGQSGPSDLDFLEHMPGLRALEAGWPDIRDFQGLAAVADSLVSLSLGSTRRKTSLEPLRRLTSLVDLSWGGSCADLAAIAALPSLRELSLTAVPLTEVLGGPFSGSLEALTLHSAVRQARLELPESLNGLRFLQVERDTKVADIDAVGELRHLEFLSLDHLPALTRLPAFSGLPRLERLELFGLKRLADLSAVKAAPALREIVLSQLPLKAPAVVEALAGLPLRKATLGLDSRKEEQAAMEQMLLPSASRSSPWSIPWIRRPIDR